jgi:cytochrome P450
MIVLLLTALIVPVVLFVVQRYVQNKKKRSHTLIVPVAGNWFLGNLKDLMADKFLTTLREFPLKYGPFVELFLFSHRVLLITNIVIAKEALFKRPKKFGRLKALNYAAKTLNAQSSLFYSSGATWNRLRKSCVPSFSHLNIVNKVTDIAREIFSWVKDLKRDSNLAKKSIDMQHEAFLLTTRIITVVAFGLPTDHPLVAYFIGDAFRQDVLKFFAFGAASAGYPFPRFLWKYQASKYKLELDGIDATARIAEEGKKIIDYKRELVKEGKLTTSHCMIDTMVLNEGNSERALSDIEIIMNVRGFYTAGADTTAIILTWAAYYFALYPEIAERIRREAIELLFCHRSPPEIVENGFGLAIFKSMVYTNAVLNEILRLKSPSTVHILELEEENDEYQFPNGIKVFSGDRLYLNIDGIQTDPKVFEDPFAFNPDRWLTNDAEKLSEMQNSLIAFGFGPRICPGMGLATHEALLALAIFAYYFNFTLNCPKEDIVRITSFVASANKMPMIITPRADIIE